MRTISVFLCGVLLLASQVVLAQESIEQPEPASQRYEKAVLLFEEGDYKNSQQILVEILFPKPLIKGADKIAKAHVLLSAAYLALGNMDAADRVVKVIIEGDVNFRFDTEFDPSLIEMADRHREARKQEMAKETAKEQPAVAAAPIEAPQSSGLNTMLHILPFGVGQFVDGRYVAGSIYFAIQAGLAGAAAYFWIDYKSNVGDELEANKPGTFEENGAYNCPLDPSDTNRCMSLQTTNNIFQAAFLASMALSIAESFIFQPSERGLAVQPAVSFNLAPLQDGAAAAFSLSF